MKLLIREIKPHRRKNLFERWVVKQSETSLSELFSLPIAGQKLSN
jgi:hypothetical protein